MFMCSLSMMESKLPPGFRFHPRDEELISDYLAGRVSGDCNGLPAGLMVDVDLNKCEPWDLPEMARVGGNEWYFYSQRDRKYASGQRTNRTTITGYWKATGKDRPIVDPRRRRLVGMRKTLVFYHGRGPNGRKTDWIMHEFRVERSAAGTSATSFPVEEDWVLCRIFHRSRGPLSKPSTENSERNAGLSSFPPLVDGFISPEQAQLSLKGCPQVPCSSSNLLGQQAAKPQSSSAALHVSSAERNMHEMLKSFTHLGGMSNLDANLNHSPYEKREDDFPNLHGYQRVEGSSSSYVRETCAPPMRNQPF